MTDDRTILNEYFKAVGRHWWAIITGLALTLLDGVERLFGTWYRPPLWAKVSAGVAGLAIAQYLAYRDLALGTPDNTTEFKQRLRAASRNAELQWELLDRPEAVVTPQMVCKQIDEFSAVLAELYSQCPAELDSQLLRDAIAKLRGTEAHRVGNFFGTQQDADKITEQMEGAFENVRATLQRPK